MGQSRRRLPVVVLLCILCCIATGQLTDTNTDKTLLQNAGAVHSAIPRGNSRPNNFMRPFRDRTGPVSSRFNRFKQNTKSLDTFNRPEGTESLVMTTNNDGKAGTGYGITFGQYGSYKKHSSWQKAVANDRQRHIFVPEDLKVKFPWLLNNLHTPTVQGFGLNGFWNSYALPEGTSTVRGLGPTKFGETNPNNEFKGQ